MSLERKHMVMTVTLCRVFAGLLLVVAGVGQWWGLSACLLAIGYATNVADVRLMRRWHIETPASGRLKNNANATLTFCALAAMTLGGLWPWETMLLVGLWVALRLAEPRLHGDWRVAARVFPPMASLLLLAGVEATLIHQWLGVRYTYILVAESLLCACLCYWQRGRALDFFRYTLAEED